MTTTDKTLPSRFMVNNDVKDVMTILSLHNRDITKKELITLMYTNICRCIFDGLLSNAIGILAYNRNPKHLEILLLYAHPEYNTKFILSQFINELKDKIRESRRKKLLFWVSDIDLETQLLLQDNEFKAVKVKDDVYLMEYIL